jgi:hypothetical protein
MWPALWTGEKSVMNHNYSRWQRALSLIASVLVAVTSVQAVWALTQTAGVRAQPHTGAPAVVISSVSTAAGSQVTITGTGFAVGAGNIRISFVNQTLNEVIGEAAPPDFTREIVIPNEAAAGLATLHVCVEVACGTGSDQDVTAPVRVLPQLREVPTAVTRRMLDFLSTIQASVPEWDGVTVAGTVYPYFRPDMDDPAYYEFALLDPSGQPAGFIIAATGEHDYPIAHWSASGEPLATALLRAADGQALNFYKLSPLTYGAETPDRQRLIRAEGEENPMLKVSGLNTIDLASLNTEFEWTAEQGFSQTGVITTPAGLSVSDWASWPELRDNYAQNYAPILEVRREHAAGEWASAHQREEVGISLVPGESYRLLLPGPAHYTLSGTVASLVTIEPEPDALQISAISAPPSGAPFDISLDYEDGRQETVHFLAIDWQPNNILLPVVIGNAPASRMATGPAATATASSQTLLGWIFAYADGGRGGQRLYNQIAPSTWPNVTSCHSGCGATAWSMLFGFGDNQADIWPINSWWMNKWGLYRKDGGINTGDVAAPLVNDNGVNNMQMEIRREIGTFCLGNSGATWPWRMGGAYRYVERRSWAWVHVYGGYNFINNEYQHVANSIILQHTPGIILTGSFDTLHYPLAYGFAQARVRECGWDLFKGYTCEEKIRYPYFQINPGWGPYSPSMGSWTPASTGYHGEAFPCYYVWQGWNLVRVCP